MEGFEPIFSIKQIFSGLPNRQPEAHRSMTSSYLPPYEAGFRLGNGIIGSYDAPPPFLSGSQYFCSSKKVEGQLSELAINAVDDHLCKSRPVSMMMKMTDAKVLFHDVADLLDGFVSFFFIWR
ncbi:MAG: hypothetical protein WCO26_26170 [Deltaproteobacteria bacterium]